MMNGSTNITVKDEKGDVADITISDVRQSNGVIQVVDHVLHAARLIEPRRAASPRGRPHPSPQPESHASAHPSTRRAHHALDQRRGDDCVMIGSGWQIYNASPLFAFTFPPWMTLGGWLGGAIAWHFAAMWLLAGNLRVYLGYGIASGPFPPPPVAGAAARDLARRHARAALPAAARRGTYNAVQRLLYVLAGSASAGVVVRPRDLEAGAVLAADRAARRLRDRATRPLLRHGRHRRRSSSCISHWSPSCRARCRPMLTGGRCPADEPAIDPADHRRALERVSRRLFLRGRSVGRRAVAALRLQSRGRRRGGPRAVDDVALERHGAGRAVQPRPPRADLSASDITDPFPFNAYYPERGAPGRWRYVSPRDSRPDRRQAPWTLADLARAAADLADHAPHLHRGLERDRRMARRAVQRLPRAHRRRSRCALRAFRCADDYSQQHRHGDRAASADVAGARLPRRAAAARSTASR